MLKVPVVKSWRVTFFLALALIVIFVLTAATPIAVGPHHIMAVYPIPHAIVAIAIGAVWSAYRVRKTALSAASMALVAGGFVAIVAVNLNMASQYYTHILAKGSKGFWLESIFELPKLIGSTSYDKVVVLDWSIEHPLIVLGEDRIPLNIPMWELATRGPDQEFYKLLARNNLYVARSTKFSIDPKIRLAFEQAYKSKRYVADERKVYQQDGEESYSTISLKRQSD